MSDRLTCDLLHEAVSGRATGLRCRSTLQPAGGPGTKVFPPTYAGGVYATEYRRLPDHEEPVPCVLLDSVQSQANRMEEALLEARDRGDLDDAGIPLIEVDFGGFWAGDGAEPTDDQPLIEPIGRISSLEAPHRAADAILRDSLVGDDAFRNSAVGRRITQADARRATALFEWCPTSLLFGMWDSTGPKGGLGTKIERAIVGEVVGINAVFGVRTSSRIDPLGIRLGAGTLYQASEGPLEWTLNEETAVKKRGTPQKLGKSGKPSEANHGNVTPSLSSMDREAGRHLGGGVTIDHAEHSVVISLAALRRLCFPLEGAADSRDPEQRARDDAARTTLAAMGILAATLAADRGMDLRSRCLLWPSESVGWELLDGPGSVRSIDVDVDAALEAFKESVSRARNTGLPWATEPLVLTPSPDLVRLVASSQSVAVEEGADAEGN